MSKPRYKLKLRAINNGTRYDVAGSLKRLARRIERGELGDVRDVVITTREVGAGGSGTGVRVGAFHFGTGDIATALWTLEAGKSQITG